MIGTSSIPYMLDGQETQKEKNAITSKLLTLAVKKRLQCI